MPISSARSWVSLVMRASEGSMLSSAISISSAVLKPEAAATWSGDKPPSFFVIFPRLLRVETSPATSSTRSPFILCSSVRAPRMNTCKGSPVTVPPVLSQNASLWSGLL